jgi:hypothetical protein
MTRRGGPREVALADQGHERTQLPCRQIDLHFGSIDPDFRFHSLTEAA